MASSHRTFKMAARAAGRLCPIFLTFLAGSASAGDLEEAVRLSGDGRHDEAERVLRELAGRPGGSDAALELAGLLERLGEIDAAAEMYGRALSGGDPGDPRRKRLEARLDRCRRQRLSLALFPVSL